MADVLVLQHVAYEPPGVYEDVLRERGAGITRVELDMGEPIPSRSFDAVIAMGGPMSVNDEAWHPWLVAEERLIGEVARDGKPFWGACLGVQLLASALGARVYPGSSPEVGMLPVVLTEEGRKDPVTGVLPTELTTLQWHGDTFDVPDGARLLAWSEVCPNQAIRFRNAYGVQFHLRAVPSGGVRVDGAGVGARARIRAVRRSCARTGLAARGVARGRGTGGRAVRSREPHVRGLARRDGSRSGMTTSGAARLCGLRPPLGGLGSSWKEVIRLRAMEHLHICSTGEVARGRVAEGTHPT